MKIVDAFIFFNELELLKARFVELYDIVDYFILVEGTVTFTGLEKPLYYKENKDLFEKYNDKVIHIVVDNYPVTTNAWDREHHQRNCIAQGIHQLNLDSADLIIISDVDEIVSSEKIYNIKYGIIPFIHDIYILEMQLYYYSVEWTVNRKWRHVKIVTNNFFNHIKLPEQIRHYPCNNIIQNGGWHISYFGDPYFIVNKLKSFSETQDCNEKNLNINYLESCILNGTLHFNNESLIKVPQESNISLPYYFLKNKVPKTIFSFWEGSQLSMLSYYTLLSFRKLNPSFEVILYYSEKPENFVHNGEVTNKIHASGFNYSDDKKIDIEYINSIPNVSVINIDVEKEYNIQFTTSPIHKADIVRIMKLYEHGGIWIDLDILCIKPIPPYMIKSPDIQYFTYYNTVPTGLLISTPKNECIEYIYNYCKTKIHRKNINNDWQQFGPTLWNTCILDNILFKNCSVLDNKTVYPYMWNEPEILFFTNEDRVLPITFCIHWYNGNINSRKYIDKFESTNIDENRCVFEKYLSHILRLS